MVRVLVALAVSLALVSAVPADVRAGTFVEQQRKAARARQALDAHTGELRAAFTRAGAAWPPRGVFLRGFKHEGQLELWAAPVAGREGWVLVRAFPICAASGVLGPKVQAGDGQVPEGFYTIDRFNPWSSYHLSLGLDYPNAVDLKRPRTGAPGGDIFIHGSCVTIGCIPLEDEPVEVLYAAAVLARDQGQRRIPVHVFPCRMDRRACADLLRKQADKAPSLAGFWAQLQPGYAAFEATHVPPRVEAGRDGRYRLVKSPGSSRGGR